MDSREMAGEKPMMPAPPKVCPLRPVSVPELPVEPVVALPLVPAPPEVPVGLPAVGAGEPGLAGELVEPMRELLPMDEPDPEPPLIPFPPLGPIPAITEPPAEPAPAIGWPKKPSVWVLAWPKRMGFQSSLPVMGSGYFLRRKRISLVLTNASMLGGKAWNFL